VSLISAVVVTHNSSAVAAECVASLQGQRLPARVDLQIVVVDSGSRAEERDMLEGLGAQIVPAGDVGHAAAVNLGARACSSPYLLMSDADTVYDQVAVGAILEAIEDDPAVAAAGPQLFLDHGHVLRLPPEHPDAPVGTDREEAAGRLRAFASAAHELWTATEPIDQPALSGAAVLVEREAFDAVGGMIEGFHASFDDLDLCRRLRAAGRRLVAVPSARVVHLHGRSGEDERAEARFAVSARRSFAKHFGARAAAALDETGGGSVAPVREPVDLGDVARPPRLASSGPTLFVVAPVPGGVPAAGDVRADGILDLTDVPRPAAGQPVFAYALALPEMDVVAAWRWTLDAKGTPTGAADGLHVRDARPDDTAALVELFADVFDDEMSEAAWHWKYFARPGTAISQVTEVEGRIAGHAGGCRHVYAYRGRAEAAFESGDVMARADVRSRGVWSAATSALRTRIEREGLFGHGFASEYVARVGAAKLDHYPLGRVHLLHRPELDPPPGPPRETQVSDAPPLDWDVRWPPLEAAFALVRRRDRAYLRWRYTDRPDRRYRFLDDRRTGGLAVVQVGGPDAYLMELLVPGDDPAALGRLALAAERVATDHGARGLSAWFPAWSRTAALLQSACGYSGGDGDQVLIVGHHRDELTPAWFSEHFFYSLGDWDVQ
jgi:GT2 family glycosyltransferase